MKNKNLKSRKIIKEFLKDQPRFEKNITKLVKKGKNKPIKDEVFHKVKAGDRRREIELAKLDLENSIDDFLEREEPRHFIGYQGEYGKRREQIKKYNKMIKYGIIFIILIPIMYILLIYFLDIFS